MNTFHNYFMDNLGDSDPVYHSNLLLDEELAKALIVGPETLKDLGSGAVADEETCYQTDGAEHDVSPLSEADILALGIQVKNLDEKNPLENEDMILLARVSKVGRSFRRQNNDDSSHRKIINLGQYAESVLFSKVRPFIVNAARNIHLSTHSMPTEDFIQEGYFGLVKAIDAFDPNKGEYFFPFAARCIEAEMKNAVGRFGTSPIVLRKHIASKMLGINTLRGQGLTDEEVARELGITTDRIAEIEKLYNRARIVKSLDQTIGRDEEETSTTLLDILDTSLIDAEEASGLEVALEMKRKRNFLMWLATKIEPSLSPHEKILLKEIYNLDVDEGEFIVENDKKRQSARRISWEHGFNEDATYVAKFRLESKFKIAASLEQIRIYGLVDAKEIEALYLLFIGASSKRGGAASAEECESIRCAMRTLREAAGKEIDESIAWIESDLQTRGHSETNARKYQEYFLNLFDAGYRRQKGKIRPGYISPFVQYRYIPEILDRIAKHGRARSESMKRERFLNPARVENF